MCQARRQEKLHDEATHTQGEQIGPLSGTTGQLEPNFRDEDETARADYRAPGRKIVDGDERMGSFTDPTDGGICTLRDLHVSWTVWFA